MQKLTNVGENLVNDIASRYGLSRDAVVHMLVSVNNGGCSMAQFNCPELGGSGQWMRGGMTMVGDMFNNGLKTTVDNLCNELANILSNNQVFPVVAAGTPGSSQWWPMDLGSPSSSGSQNNTRYAVFPNRLAVELNGQVSIYDTLDHNIGGVSQQQGGNDSLTFNSQWGTISVNNLPLVSGTSPAPAPQTNFAQPVQEPQPTQAPVQNFEQTNEVTNSQYNTTNQMIGIIKKLAELRDVGVLTESEFNAKKAELLK
ncbi:SHOCT domain-containing protein [Pseudocolwellia sp. AS88]|uniref:SHOCT domain-containing protein n=1 Tax=Pseudocolwellia sp. AS88 TaxID=3063958 RepID=UPI0026EBCED0|nr:SHOCT domain-containing protein [Pseudocolwellia sp. AS88]MDO7083937.1 SHOCT domain-containing protein [Pseudocolwellia sp. AS88]